MLQLESLLSLPVWLLCRLSSPVPVSVCPVPTKISDTRQRGTFVEVFTGRSSDACFPFSFLAHRPSLLLARCVTQRTEKPPFRRRFPRPVHPRRAAKWKTKHGPSVSRNSARRIRFRLVQRRRLGAAYPGTPARLLGVCLPFQSVEQVAALKIEGEIIHSDRRRSTLSVPLIGGKWRVSS